MLAGPPFYLESLVFPPRHKSKGQKNPNFSFFSPEEAVSSPLPFQASPGQASKVPAATSAPVSPQSLPAWSLQTARQRGKKTNKTPVCSRLRDSSDDPQLRRTAATTLWPPSQDSQTSRRRHPAWPAGGGVSLVRRSGSLAGGTGGGGGGAWADAVAAEERSGTGRELPVLPPASRSTEVGQVRGGEAETPCSAPERHSAVLSRAHRAVPSRVRPDPPPLSWGTGTVWQPEDPDTCGHQQQPARLSRPQRLAGGGLAQPPASTNSFVATQPRPLTGASSMRLPQGYSGAESS